MMIPSSKLIESVFGFPVRGMKIVDNTFICAKRNNAMYTEIRVNVYELMHMMKEWIRETYDADITIEYNRVYEKPTVILTTWVMDIGTHKEKTPTEFEAVTKACEYILEEKK